ncbi:hypothetical protein H8I69_15005 [Serratia fonticola]|uniref:hypothetical protein n=1 Tax=Serratia fonticola TaxID=47917 RepID=UPI0015C5F971|nr:hypothetical protein [Serratia fonticola]MBC3380424.1 hypothetical protein [Serratia fonticola]NYA39623.1 hypothetical protein [Serratia fonticola]
MPKLILKNFFVCTIDTKRHFYTDFGEHVNIIHGRNTSGKSTLIQSILYTMGVNDSKENLDEIISNNIVFRLECEKVEDECISKLVFVRSGDTLVIQYDDTMPMRFDGINSNNSYEYSRYKDLFCDLFKFDLKLQKQTELAKAPLEAAFLPYYISQSVGWVYIRESIGDYRFYKDFKLDYLDYYTGIKTENNRIEKYELQKEKQSTEFELKQIINYKSRNSKLKLAEFLDKRFKDKSIEYLQSYNELNFSLSSEEAAHTKLCNSISMLRGRQKVLSQVISNIQNQKPRIDLCPTCEQLLPGNLRSFYIYNQDINDALKQKEKVAETIKKSVSMLNSVEKKIITIRDRIQVEYGDLVKFKVEEIEYSSWLEHHANISLIKDLYLQESLCRSKISEIQEKINKLGDDSDIETLRLYKEREFFEIFKAKAKALDVEIPKNNKYRNLYSISSFPYQGVQLHKIVMAYNFAFNDIVYNNSYLHHFPFLLDAVLKEDIDIKNRDEIFTFLANESKTGKQILLTIAEFKGENGQLMNNPLFSIKEINRKYFKGVAKQVCIGDAVSERAFLSTSILDEKKNKLLEGTISLLEAI